MERKICIVTGAAGGVGIEIVRAFLKEGHLVVMADISEKALNVALTKLETAPENVVLCPLDISDEEAVRNAYEELYRRLGRIDVLVNTAGICGEYALCTDYSFANFKKIYEVNVFGTFLMMKYVLPYMKARGAGRIINFGSVSGIRGYQFEVGYGSSKAAIIQMSRNIASEYGEFGVTCNSVSPGWVETAMMEKTLDNYRRLGIEEPEKHINSSCLHRSARPEEIADAVVFLCSDKAAYFNGANIVIDGGMTIE